MLPPGSVDSSRPAIGRPGQGLAAIPPCFKILKRGGRKIAVPFVQPAIECSRYSGYPVRIARFAPHDDGGCRRRCALVAALCPGFLLALLLSGPCFAHEDRVLALEKDGSLTGLPSEYGPASLRLAFRSNGSARQIAEGGITIRGRSSTLPGCVLAAIRSKSADDIYVSASWYHDERTLPYYISVLFLDSRPRDDSNELGSFTSVVCDLRTARPIEIERDVASWIPIFGSRSRRPIPLDRCTATEMRMLQLEPLGN